MQPNSPTPEIAPEQIPQKVAGTESISNGEVEAAPLGVEANLERVEQQAEARAALTDVVSTTLPTDDPSDDSTDGRDDVDNTTVTDSPITAADDDLIEKEWVDKAKQIISTTQGDPYQRDRKVSKLRVDYLSKRYGKEIKPVE